MRRLLTIICVLAPLAATAQDEGSRLENLLENQLSSEGRVVEIDGFEGALSSEATMAALRVSDDQGVWLELTDLKLNWNRLALLRARLSVEELSAGTVTLTRLPEAAETQEVEAPPAEASGFRIPELPVAVIINRMALEEINIGEAVLGEAVRATLDASVLLDDGILDIELDALRTDDKPGQALIDLGFTPEDEVLTIDLDISEPEGGIVARALSLPGLPSVELTVSGGGPFDAFDAQLALATNDEERLEGRAQITGREDGGRGFELDVSGDIQPLLAPDVRGFFGEETALTAQGEAAPDGALILESLRVEAAQLLLEGSGAIAAEGGPERLALTGILGREGRTTLPGTDVSLSDVTLDLNFDATASDELTLDVTASDVATADITVATLDLDGVGQFRPGTETPFDGDITAQIQTLDIQSDPALTAVIGDLISLTTGLTIEQGGPYSLAGLSLETANASATGDATVTPTEGRVAIEAALALAAPDLAPFSDLAGTSLAGQVAADVTAEAELPGGAMAVTFEGRTQSIDIGVEALDPILTPETTLTAALRRDETGTRIEELTLDNPEVTAEISGDIDAENGEVAITAQLREVGLFTDLVDGPFAIDLAMTDIRGDRTIEGGIDTEFGLAADLSGALAGTDAGVALVGTLAEVERFVPQLNGTAELETTVDLAGEFPAIDATVAANPGVTLSVQGPLSGPDQGVDIDALIADLSAFAPPVPGPVTLTGRISEFDAGPLLDLAFAVETGGIDGTLTGRPTGDNSEISLVAEADTLGFLAPQLAGSARAEVSLSDLAGLQTFAADVESAIGVSAQASGNLAGPDDALTVGARVADLNRFVDQLSGGAQLEGQVSGIQSSPSFAGTLSTDFGARAQIDAAVPSPDNLAISASGSVPLITFARAVGSGALTGTAIFDVALNGAPELGNVRANVTTNDAGFFDPAINLTLRPIRADVAVANSRADIDVRAQLNGGNIDVTGGVGLAGAIPVDIEVTSNRLPVILENLAETLLTTQLNIVGSATESISVSGLLQIDETEIRIPDTGVGGATPIPDIDHLSASGEVRQTLDRAGFELTVDTTPPTPPIPIPLDVTLEAATPIFVRGRGLDAGFDGAVRITGSAAAPLPVGEFNLTRGRLNFLGRRFALTEGRIANEGSFIPNMTVVGEVTVDEVTARIELDGPVDDPEFELTSVPELPEDEILARILFGESIDSLSTFQLARLVSSIRTLTGAGGDGILERTRQSLGVDDIDLRLDEETGEASLAVGQALSENVYSEVEIENDGVTTLNLNFDLTDDTTLRASGSSDGNSAFGVFWERDY